MTALRRTVLVVAALAAGLPAGGAAAQAAGGARVVDDQISSADVGLPTDGRRYVLLPLAGGVVGVYDSATGAVHRVSGLEGACYPEAAGSGWASARCDDPQGPERLFVIRLATATSRAFSTAEGAAFNGAASVRAIGSRWLLLFEESQAPGGTPYLVYVEWRTAEARPLGIGARDLNSADLRRLSRPALAVNVLPGKGGADAIVLRSAHRREVIGRCAARCHQVVLSAGKVSWQDGHLARGYDLATRATITIPRSSRSFDVLHTASQLLVRGGTKATRHRLLARAWPRPDGFGPECNACRCACALPAPTPTPTPTPVTVQPAPRSPRPAPGRRSTVTDS